MSDKVKYELEYIIRTSPKILYQMISTPSGLSDWFSDDVNVEKDTFTFIWERSEETAELVSKKFPDFIRFRWVEEDEDTFFEFRIKIDPMTNEVALIVTDFADPDEEEENKSLWDSQVSELKHVLGS